MGGLMQPAVNLAVEKIVGQKIKEAVGEAIEKNTKEVTEKVTAEVSVKVATETDKVSKLEAIRNLMETTNWSIDKVMDALKIPPALQIELKPLL